MFQASFRQGKQIAVSLRPDEGKSTAFDGCDGHFSVAKHDPRAPGFLGTGRLEYVGGHYLKARDGTYFLKGGTDSPENFLAYAGFERTAAGKFGLHTFAVHESDWRPGDPDWGDGRGRGIIGAINYLAGQGVNSIYFLTMNIGGDGQDVWPFAGWIDPAGHPDNNNLHYDVGKLLQWEVVFAHAQRHGIALHFVLNEAEAANKRELDNGELGVERKLYYRELIARFAHHNALFWNLCEEYNLNFDLGPDRIKAFAGYLSALDPYDHPIGVHNQRDAVKTWAPFFGDERISLTSVQYHPDSSRTFGDLSYIDLVETLRRNSRQAGRPLPICLDEFDRLGKRDDESRLSKWPYASGSSRLRKEVLWPIYLSGGQVEYILEDLLATDDFRPYEAMWQYTHNARRIMEGNVPFWEMEPANTLLTGANSRNGCGQVLRKRGDSYLVYLPAGNVDATLDLSETDGVFLLRWYDPRDGRLKGDSSHEVMAGTTVSLGSPPEAPGEDWVVLLRRKPDAGGRPNPAAPSATVFRDQGGYVVVELEALPLPGDRSWIHEQDTAFAPFAGTGYLRATVDKRQPGQDLIEIPVDLDRAGIWHLYIRTRHDHPRIDLENDIFLQIDDGPWLKFWMGKPIAAWSWSDLAHGLDVNYRFPTEIAGNLAAGRHTIRIAARSANFRLDRLALFLEPHRERALSLSTPSATDTPARH